MYIISLIALKEFKKLHSRTADWTIMFTFHRTEQLKKLALLMAYLIFVTSSKNVILLPLMDGMDASPVQVNLTPLSPDPPPCFPHIL